MGFFSYADICRVASLTVCPLISPALNNTLSADGAAVTGVDPICYARSMALKTNIVYEAGAIFMYVIAILMAIVMLASIKNKYTAIGRKEISIFFYLYIISNIMQIFLYSNIATAFHVGLITASIWCLFLNGLVGFQFVEDGTNFSLWSIRLSTLAILCITTLVGVLTFYDKSGFSHTQPTILFYIHFVFNGALLVIYFIMQIVLVFKCLDNLWPLGDILISCAFFVFGQILLLVLSNNICEQMKHYFDGLFFEAIFTLLAVMMIYKYWDSITKEDLEFSVGGKLNTWELKDGANIALNNRNNIDNEYYYGFKN